MQQPDTFYIKAGDRYPVIAGTLETAPGVPQNLTGWTVKFIMRRADRMGAPVSSSATIVDATTGQVSYAWAASDTAEPGDFVAEWQATETATGKTLTFPNDQSLRIRIEPQIGS